MRREAAQKQPKAGGWRRFDHGDGDSEECGGNDQISKGARIEAARAACYLACATPGEQVGESGPEAGNGRSEEKRGRGNKGNGHEAHQENAMYR